jgi:hypothetical protein
MRAITAGEWDAMRDEQDTATPDMAQIGTWAPVANTYGEQEPAWTYSAPIACSYQPTDTKEVIAGDKTIVHSIGRVRFPVGTTITARDMIHVTKRAGDHVSIYFWVAGQPEQYATAVVVPVERVTV